MKNIKKLAIHKVTLRDLDEPLMRGIAGGVLTDATCPAQSCKVCPTDTAKVGECCSVKRDSADAIVRSISY
jgi:hypothetical protein